MPSNWIQHVKKYQDDHGCSYRDAMTLSRPSYTKESPTVGGKIQISNIVKKAQKKINSLGPQTKEDSPTVGGKMKIKNVIRKAGKTMSAVAPLVGLLAPEVGIGLELGSRAVALGRRKYEKKKKAPKQNLYLGKGGSFRVQGGSAVVQGAVAFRPKPDDHSITGGSFKVQGAGISGMKHGGCLHCGQPYGGSSSVMISPTHNSFRPLKPKSLSVQA
jgi:hypothetical protein